MTKFRFKAAVALGALATVAGSMLLAAACSSSTKADATPSTAANTSTTATQATSAASDAPAVISAINILNGAGLHEFDQSIASGTVPPTAQNVVTQLAAIVKLTPWPDALKSQAENMEAVFQTYVTQLNTDKPDMTTLGTAAHNAHEGEHDFSHDVWDWLYKQAGMNTTAPSGDSDAASTSTAATH